MIGAISSPLDLITWAASIGLSVLLVGFPFGMMYGWIRAMRKRQDLQAQAHAKEISGT